MTTTPPPLPPRENKPNEEKFPSTPQRSMLAWPAGVAFAAYTLVACWLAYRSQGGSEFWMSNAAGRMIAGLVIGLLVAWIAYRVSGRNRTTATAAFSILLAVAALGGVSQLGRQALERRAQEDLARVSAEAMQEMRETIESGDISEKSTDPMGRIADAMEKAGADSTSGEAPLMKIGADFVRESQAQAVQYNKALNAFVESGGVDAGGLDSIEQIDRRIAITHELGAASDVMDKFIANAVAEVRKRVEASGADARAKREFMAGFEGSAKLETVRKIRQKDKEVVVAAVEMLELLKRRWGTWEYQPEDGSVLFESDEDVAAYNASMTKLNTAAVEQERLQREMLQQQERALP